METDRSRIIAYQTCPRQRFYAYHLNGTGLQRIRKSLPLQFGSAFHVGSQWLLTQKDIEYAVLEAKTFLEAQFSAHAVGFDNELPDDAQKALEYGQQEQMALAEALLRAWWAYEGESFLQNFEVIEVEKEGRAILNSATRLHSYELMHEVEERNDALTLLLRPDALIRDRASGDLYIVSWKTCATFTKRTVDQCRHDMQSMSEVWGVESTFGEPPHDHCVEGVLYKFIVKGRRTKDDWDGLYKQDSHLIYGWRKLGAAAEDAEWSWRYAWTDPEDVNPKTGRAVNHKLGKGWMKVPIWREYPGGVKQWIADIASGSVFPRHMDALGAVFPQALPVERRADEVESWKRQIIHQETQISMKAEAVEYSPTPKIKETMLDIHFPQSTHSCHSYSGCPFIPVCWEGVPAEVGEIYQIRSANHPEGKGYSDE